MEISEKWDITKGAHFVREMQIKTTPDAILKKTYHFGKNKTMFLTHC